jgi:site-specific DNA-methyltransferase (adenine-specific)
MSEDNFLIEKIPSYIVHGNFYEELYNMRPNTVDMILTDLPYGKNIKDWDMDIDLSDMWELFGHVLKPNGIVALTSIEPFTSKLIMSNLDIFKYKLLWVKTRISNPLLNKKMPSKIHEEVLIFYKNYPTYNPQTYEVSEKYVDKRKNVNDSEWVSGQFSGKMTRKKDLGIRQPQDVLYFPSHWSKGMHPTQKPVPLFEYLIKTYTNEDDTVLDCCAGSGTTAIACENTNRNYICIEKEPRYFEMMEDRIKNHNLKKGVVMNNV